MDIEIYAGEEEDFYIRMPGSAGSLRWFRQQGSWSKIQARLPSGIRQVEFGELPDELLEEVLAFVARVEVIGSQIWNAQN